MNPEQFPDRKVTIGVLGGAVGILVVYFVGLIWGVVIPAEPAMALQTVVIFALQYLVPNGASTIARYQQQS